MRESQPVLEVRGLMKVYRRRIVVNQVDFFVAPGEVVGLLGSNGAGKTTSFCITCGLIEPDGGSVWLGGLDVTSWSLHRRARDGGLGYLPQDSSLIRKLSVEDNLLGVMELLGIDRQTRRRQCDQLLAQFGITQLRRSKAGQLSGGERRRLEIARSLVSSPKIILLDEPFAGVDPLTVANIQGVVRGLRNDGIAVLITDHQWRETLEIADRTYIIDDGRVLCSGTSAEVQADPSAQARYFGKQAAKA